MRKKLLLACSFGLITSMLSAQAWDEDLDGDLSGDFSNPTTLTFMVGSNDVIAAQQGSPRDVDYFTFTVPAGHVLADIDIDDYVAADPNNLAFIGIQAGSAFSTNFDVTTAADLLGGKTYGTDDIDINILPSMGLLSGAIGYTGALGPGDYTVWLNQTGDASVVELSFFIQPDDGDTQLWDDLLDGDLSDDHTIPTGVFNLNDGNNDIVSSVQGTPRDIDYITFTVPTGRVLTQIAVDNYIVANNSNLAFIGIIQGGSFPNDANTTAASDLLGGKTIGVSDIGNDILQDMGTLPGATGFTGNLTAGTYSIWFNQTGDESEIDLNFVVADPTLSTIAFTAGDIQLFPNPADTKFNITSTAVIESVRITDELGRSILFETAIEKRETSIDTSALSTGLYFAIVTTEKGAFTKRIIKN
ncbi:T9SS type A sorting domain-containing protein [Sungkyunkwania multivorans]|uniref:T9SS type A sorting domain-containing protein n=1 Tax=Sungkyunkwania multivorans TaxID=1173618 RepID=A0ABW3D4S2_9FLAO